MRIAIVGCGYVASSYVRTLPNHSNLQLVGVFDRDADRRRRYAEFFRVDSYSSFDAVMADPKVEMIVNLTNPASHYEVSKAALEAGKHVYSEKPLATELNQAQELVELAERRGLLIASAPCSLLSETAQTIWKALRDGSIGTPRLVYAELEDGIFFLKYREFANELGIPWPYQHEFETGCTLEHAGYYLGWLTAFFGPAKRILSFAGVVPDKKVTTIEREIATFTLACIEFPSGLIARITCSTYTDNEHTLRIFGDGGILSTPHCWNYGSPVYLTHRPPITWREKHPRRARMLRLQPTIPLVRPSAFQYDPRAFRMDFSRGIAELADAISEHRAPRLSARWSLHVTELALKMNAGEGIQRDLQTTFEPIAPMPWAASDVSSVESARDALEGPVVTNAGTQGTEQLAITNSASRAASASPRR